MISELPPVNTKDNTIHCLSNSFLKPELKSCCALNVTLSRTSNPAGHRRIFLLLLDQFKKVKIQQQTFPAGGADNNYSNFFKRRLLAACQVWFIYLLFFVKHRKPLLRHTVPYFILRDFLKFILFLKSVFIF